MERIINVKGKVGRYDVPSFTYADNKTLKIRLKMAEKRVGKYYAIISCGEEKKTVCLGKEMTIEVSPEFIKKGNYNPICILLDFRNATGDKVIICNDPAKEGFFIEPLCIERVTENVTAIGWLSKIEKEIFALKEEQKSMSEKLSKYEDEGVPLLCEKDD